VKPKKAEDEQDDDHKADEIDDAVHGVVTSGATIHRRIVRVQTKSLEKLVAFQNVPKLRWPFCVRETAANGAMHFRSTPKSGVGDTWP
jgi:hypothetical protein